MNSFPRLGIGFLSVFAAGLIGCGGGETTPPAVTTAQAEARVQETVPSKPAPAPQAKPKVTIDPEQEFQRVVQALNTNKKIKQAWFEMNEQLMQVLGRDYDFYKEEIIRSDDGTITRIVSLENYEWLPGKNTGLLFWTEEDGSSVKDQKNFYRVTVTGSDKGLNISKIEEYRGKKEDTQNSLSNLGYTIKIEGYGPPENLKKFWDLVLKNFSRKGK